MKKKVNFSEINRAQRSQYKHGTKIINFTSDDVEKAREKKLEEMVREAIKAKFAESSYQGSSTARDTVEEILIENGLKQLEVILPDDPRYVDPNEK